MSQCKHAPKTPWLPWVHTGPKSQPGLLQTRVMCQTTHTNGDPLSSNDFSNLPTSLSPTPELQYSRDGPLTVPVNMSITVYSKCTFPNTWSFRQSRIQFQGNKGAGVTIHVHVLVWRSKDINLTIWRCTYTCTTRRKSQASLGHECVFFFGIYCLSQWRNWEYDPEDFLCKSLCVCVCVRARLWATCSNYAWWAFLMASHSLTFAQTLCR